MPAFEPGDAEQAIRATRAWLERAVIGLNLCPFAKAARPRLRYVCCPARDTATLADALRDELVLLRDTPAEQLETTLLIHPWVLGDFTDYNDFLDTAEAQLHALRLQGVLQIASFHPHYRFAGSGDDDIENATNRSPHPTLHLLREASIERAVAAFPDAASIYERNIHTLRTLGAQGWAALQAQCLRDASEPQRRTR
jgi:hypothetical protein